MKRFLIEREIDGAGDLTPADLADIAQTSNAAVESLGVPYNWVTSYVAGNKIYCLHETDEVETILEHARRGGFPADLVSVVANEFGPQTAEQVAVGGPGVVPAPGRRYVGPRRLAPTWSRSTCGALATASQSSCTTRT